MAKRKGLSKKIRFEVFKRDKFTCQYCGKKAPDVILNVDHIDPVAKGGSNKIINLITSCESCNSGKSDRRLDDDTVVSKQRRQLEEIQERREQIELMLEWKKSLDSLDSDVSEMISDYIESKINPYSLNETGRKIIESHLKQFGVNDLLNGVDIASEKYLKYNASGELQQESVEKFFGKLGGVIAMQNMPPIKQKLAYIKGIGKNRFDYWDNRKGSIILSYYVKALEDYGWTEAQILKDLENEVKKATVEAKNWTSWKNTLESWTNDIKSWEKPEKPHQRHPREISFEDLERYAYFAHYEIIDDIKVVKHLAKMFEGFDQKEFLLKLHRSIYIFLVEKNDFETNENNENVINDFISQEGLLHLGAVVICARPSS